MNAFKESEGEVSPLFHNGVQYKPPLTRHKERLKMKTNKRILMTAIIQAKRLCLLAVVIGMTACGGKGNSNTPSCSGTPATSQGGNNTVKSSELFEITDNQIITLNASLAQVQGEERTTLLAKIPANIKKAIGTLVAGTCNIQPDSVDGSEYLFNFNMTVSGLDDYKTLTDYYKSLGGTIKTEIANMQLKIDYSWGKLTDCAYGVLQDKTITVIFAID
jgi:hypothetical protein